MADCEMCWGMQIVYDPPRRYRYAIRARSAWALCRCRVAEIVWRKLHPCLP